MEYPANALNRVTPYNAGECPAPPKAQEPPFIEKQHFLLKRIASSNDALERIVSRMEGAGAQAQREISGATAGDTAQITASRLVDYSNDAAAHNEALAYRILEMLG